MWDELAILLLLCLLMAAASFFAGSLPLTVSLSPRNLRLLTALGTGVLVGTSLIVIIPEGIETLYSAGGSSHGHDASVVKRIDYRTLSPSSIATIPVSLVHYAERRDAGPLPVDMGVTLDADTSFALGPHGRDDTDDSTSGDDNGGDRTREEDEDDGGESSRNPHAWVGVSLISGFILMYLLDTLPRHITTSSQPQRFHISLNQFNFNRARTSSSVSAAPVETPAVEDGFDPSDPHRHSSHNGSSGSGRPSSTTTVGLVIHACADGIALGASSTTTGRLTFIIFIALLIHKAPAAFGLTAVLLKQGLSKRAARAHLVVFSLAAPIGALLTWSAAHLLGFPDGTVGSGGTEFATGVLLLFSGGTFLYVAMHTMQEGAHAHDEPSSNGYAGVPMGLYDAGPPPPVAKESGTLTEALATVAGMLLPLLTQFGHGH